MKDLTLLSRTYVQGRKVTRDPGQRQNPVYRITTLTVSSLKTRCDFCFYLHRWMILSVLRHSNSFPRVVTQKKGGPTSLSNLHVRYKTEKSLDRTPLTYLSIYVDLTETLYIFYALWL